VKTYTVSQLLRGKIGEALGAVQHRGEEVLVTRFGKHIARIVPIDSGKSLTSPMDNRSSMSLDKLSSMPVPPDANLSRKKK
jgi:prevent-host-death family protein